MKQTVLLTASLFLALASAATAQTTQPASAPKSQPEPVNQIRLTGSALDPIFAVLSLTKRDEQILIKMQDGASDLDEPGLYHMLNKISTLPPLDEATREELEAPMPPSLIRTPDRFRFMPMRMKVAIYSVKKLTAGQGYTVSPYWPSAKPMFLIRGLAVDEKNQRRKDWPVLIYSPVRPAGLPGPSDQMHGADRYNDGPLYELTGTFFRIATLPQDTGSIEWRDYPLILAWQFTRIRATRGFDPGPNATLTSILMIALLIGLIALFIMLKRKTKKSSEMFGNYQPLRDIEEDHVDGPVDPELVAAIKEVHPEIEDSHAEDTPS